MTMSIRRQLVTMAGILFFGALANSALVLYQVNRMRNDAEVVNLAGKVRGLSQRIVKLELQGVPADKFIEELDSCIPKLPSRDFALRAVEDVVHGKWPRLRQAILDAREEESRRQEMLERCEDFYKISDQAVERVQRAAESKINTLKVSQMVLLGLSLLVVVLIVLLSRHLTITLNATITTLATTSAELATTAEMQHRIGAEQASATNQTTATVEELGASSRMSAEQADRSACEVRQSLSLAEQGATSVQHSLGAMSDLKESVNQLSQNILSLSSQIDQIGEISALVGDLANQTNMLALNAAVEAAHGGEHGKGFGVVAGEIRKLADESTRSVSRINTLVLDIQQATNTAVMTTEQGTRVVEHGLRLARQIGDVFNNLKQSINRTSESTLQISLNAKQQAAAIHQVIEAIESLNAGAKDAADGLRQTSAGIRALNQAVCDLQQMVGTARD